MRVPITAIHVPGEARIRERTSLEQAVMKRMASILKFGQLQPILVKVNENGNGKEWELVDGEVRLGAIMALSVRYGMGEQIVKDAFTKWKMEAGQIDVATRDTLDPTMTLMQEFHANEDRDNFTFQEKGNYIRRIHDMLSKEHGRDWTASKTSEYIDQSEATVSHYLALTDTSNPAVQSVRVQSATTKGAALKQLKIEENRQRAERRAKEAATPEAKAQAKDFTTAAAYGVWLGDAREWIKRVPDGALDWFHWDPPYGGNEGGGGAFAAHEGIETDTEYCLGLMLNMLPEIWRALHEGGWLAIWFTPVHYQWLRLALQGHRFDSQSAVCYYCEKHLVRDAVWLAENYSCRKAEHRFWVNPYPCVWRKSNREADGHEIQRFLTKETEYFLLAGKQTDKMTPILLRSDRGNVFDFPGFPQHSLDRRHVHHKPPALLQEILTCISVPGSLGGDAGGGSGSIIEGAMNGGRKVIVAELRPEHHKSCVMQAVKYYQQKNWGPESVASWLLDKMKRNPIFTE